MEEIETKLLTTWWGVILLGTLGSFVFWVAANFYGKANRKVRWLWLYYKEGRKETLEGLIESRYYRKNYILIFIVSWFVCFILFFSITSLVIIMACSNNKYDDRILLGFLLLNLIPALFLLISLGGKFSLISKAHIMLMRAEIKNINESRKNISDSEEDSNQSSD